MLFSRRKRLADLATREEAGESFWTSQFDEKARARLLYAAVDAAGSVMAEAYWKYARDLILRDEGRFFLWDKTSGIRDDLFNFLLNGPDDETPTVIEALSVAFTIDGISSLNGNWHGGRAFDAMVNLILREHRISYELIDHHMIAFESREMHVEVVAPALSLLAGRPGWEAVERAYQDALSEIARGAADDAITDAGTALQEALTALGCEGNQLGDLIKSGKAKRLFAPHDDKVLSWVSADRSQTGDSHHASSASVADAWFTVHVVAAIILRLAQGDPRGLQASPLANGAGYGAITGDQ